MIDRVDRDTVRSAIALASRAPSVHNSQPWRWRVGPGVVTLHADRERWLPVADADGRDLALSCGAALHHLRVALAAAGVVATVRRLPRPGDPDHVATVTLRAGSPAETDLALAGAIGTRRTDRRPFGTWDVPRGFVDELVDRAAGQGAVLRPVRDERRRLEVLHAIAEAAAVQEATAGYRTETRLWTGSGAAVDGVPAANLLRDPAAGPRAARHFGTGTLDAGPALPSADADGALLLVLGTASDDPLSRLRAGEATSAVLLHATVLGLATCPLSQPLEVGSTRAMLQSRVLDGTLSPQLVLRVGWAPAGPPPPPTPRRPVDETITA